MPRGGRKETRALYNEHLQQIRTVDYTKGAKRTAHVAYLYASQDGRCGVCANPLDDLAVVDHCHETGKIRGLLCRACNLLLGAAKDDPEILRRAAQYVVANRKAQGLRSNAAQAGPLHSPPGGELTGPPQA